MSAFVLLVVGVALIAYSVTMRRRIRHRRRSYSADELARVRRAEQVLSRYVPRYLVVVTAAVTGVALVDGEWLVAAAAALVSVVLVALVERRRREVLRTHGFDLGAWGSAVIPSQVATAGSAR